MQHTSSKQRVLQASELTPLRYIPDSQSLKQWLSDRGQARVQRTDDPLTTQMTLVSQRHECTHCLN